MKPRDGRRDAPGKVLKDRRSPRRRGRMGTSVRRNKTNKTARGKKSKSDRGGRTSRTNPVFIATVAHAGNAPSAAAQSALTDFDRISLHRVRYRGWNLRRDRRVSRRERRGRVLVALNVLARFHGQQRRQHAQRDRRERVAFASVREQAQHGLDAPRVRERSLARGVPAQEPGPAPRDVNQKRSVATRGLELPPAPRHALERLKRGDPDARERHLDRRVRGDVRERLRRAVTRLVSRAARDHCQQLAESIRGEERVARERVRGVVVAVAVRGRDRGEEFERGGVDVARRGKHRRRRLEIVVVGVGGVSVGFVVVVVVVVVPFLIPPPPPLVSLDLRLAPRVVLRVI
eukprot:31552-Pelagococcus_subviridis.AAC.11